MRITVTMRDRVNKAQLLGAPMDFEFTDTVPRKDGFYVVQQYGTHTIVQVHHGDVYALDVRGATRAADAELLWGPRIEVTP